MSIGLIITIVAGVALAAMLVWFFGFKARTLKFPEGTKKTKKGNGIKCTVIFSPNTKNKNMSFVKASHKAARALREVWIEKYPDQEDKIDKLFKRFVVHTASDEDFNSSGDENYMKQINGTFGFVSRLIGYDMPMVIMRAKFNNQVEVHGGLVIHELNHYIAGEIGTYLWYSHKDEELWGKDSLESQAKEVFRSMS